MIVKFDDDGDITYQEFQMIRFTKKMEIIVCNYCENHGSNVCNYCKKLIVLSPNHFSQLQSNLECMAVNVSQLKI